MTRKTHPYPNDNVYSMFYCPLSLSWICICQMNQKLRGSFFTSITTCYRIRAPMLPYMQLYYTWRLCIRQEASYQGWADFPKCNAAHNFNTWRCSVSGTSIITNVCLYKMSWANATSTVRPLILFPEPLQLKMPLTILSGRSVNYTRVAHVMASHSSSWKPKVSCHFVMHDGVASMFPFMSYSALQCHANTTQMV